MDIFEDLFYKFKDEVTNEITELASGIEEDRELDRNYWWWQVGPYIDNKLIEITFDLLENEYDEDERYSGVFEIKDIVDEIVGDNRTKLFNVSINPIVKYSKSKGYEIEIDDFWEEIKVYFNDEE